MTEKVCLVTGATAGIGFETARALAGSGFRVIGVGRNEERCANARDRIREESGNAEVDYLRADLSSLEEIRGLADAVKARCEVIHVLVNNAGAFFRERRESADGIEMTFALNHLGYFLLTDLLLDRLKRGAPSRIVNVASDAHRRAPFDFGDPQGKRRYNGWTAYCRSKLANVFFTYELAERLEGTGVAVNALHPGVVATRFFESGNFPFLVRFVVNLLCIGPKRGARTAIHLASSPEVEGITGKYFKKCRAVKSSKPSYDRGAAARLWEISEALIASR